MTRRNQHYPPERARRNRGHRSHPRSDTPVRAAFTPRVGGSNAEARIARSGCFRYLTLWEGPRRSPTTLRLVGSSSCSRFGG